MGVTCIIFDFMEYLTGSNIAFHINDNHIYTTTWMHLGQLCWDIVTNVVYLSKVDQICAPLSS